MMSEHCTPGPVLFNVKFLASESLVFKEKSIIPFLELLKHNIGMNG